MRTETHTREDQATRKRRGHSRGKPRTLAASRAGGPRGALPPLIAGVRAAGAWLPDCQPQNQERASLSLWAARFVASVTTRTVRVTAPQKVDMVSAKAEPHLLTTAGALRWQHTCLAFLKPLEEAQLLTQDLPEQPGHEEHGPGPAGPAGVHQRVGHQGDAALGPEAAGGGACGGQGQRPVSGGRPPPVSSPGLLPGRDYVVPVHSPGTYRNTGHTGPSTGTQGPHHPGWAGPPIAEPGCPL